ncbi:MAG: outer membrane protein [Gammaproteobacteria bacterium]
MKKILLCSAALAVFASQAMASGIYVTGKVGGSNGEGNSIENDSRYDSDSKSVSSQPVESDFTKNAVAWGGAVGYEYTKWLVPLRMEAEYLYRNHFEYETGYPGKSISETEFNSNIDNQTILANFYVDVPVTRMFGVFFGGGLGEAINTTHSKIGGTTTVGHDYEGSVDDASFSWMTTAGLTVKPLKWLAFDLSYRYSDLGNITWRTGEAGGAQSGLETDDFAAQELFLAVRVDVPNMYNKPHHKKAHHKYMDK